MAILVAGCTHWIGFHIVNELLEEGYMVDGIPDHGGNENLSLFFGRNSSFSTVGIETAKEYETAIIINDVQNSDSILANKIVKIGGEQEKNEKITYIEISLLYGEWMDMNEKGMYRGKEFIQFDSNFFKEDAIYIKDFTKALLQWVRSDKLPDQLNVVSANNRMKKGVKLENSIYLRDNGPKKEILNSVLTHFEKFKEMYRKYQV